ncbi:hypothetical protein CASFOL_020908 [Castilleja foliolosa]|uniref:Uncharacterized protein n=1 Tax=Castilleja foliolosa TaxID=1961234 RepID=A0ABD3D4B0_9LAMI
MTPDTTAPSYWLNWRFLLCAIWILLAMVFASLTLWKYEGHNKSKNRATCLYKGQSWGTCSKSIRPVWLLVYRVFAFCTMWTFTLVTIYFGLASSLSIYGYLHPCNKPEGQNGNSVCADTERGSYVPPTNGENENTQSIDISSDLNNDDNCNNASVWEYALQIILQICAGAVALTDAVFWLLIYAFLVGKDYKLHFLAVCVHSVNAVFLLGDIALNNLHFPFFRIAYFVLWTCIFVVFQWIMALSFPRLIISICSHMVLVCGAPDYTMLWDI